MPSGLIKSLSAKLGKYYIRKGTEYCFKCPKCNDHKYRMEVNPKIGFFCFHCGWKGALRDLKLELDLKLIREYPYFRDRAIEKSLDDSTYKIFCNAFKEDGQNEAPTPAGLDFHISKFPEVQECPLPKGFTSQTLPGYVLGFFSKRNLSWSRETETWGWCRGNLRMRGRLVIPIRENGKVVCWVARATIDGQKPKELSPPSSVSNKSHFVYGLDDIEKGDKIVIVEGIFDCEKLKSYGYKCVSIMGSHVSDIQVGKIMSKEPRGIYIMFDGDRTGCKGAWDTLHRVISRSSYFYPRVSVVETPEGKDPDELTKEEVRELLGW